jgi:poly(A) polymerase/tRNA nucleotidyltransferase (CCA-adding enzyme)
MADLEARALRAVGDPDVRFDEDALRLLRAARLAAQLDFRVEPETRAAMSRQAHLGRHVASERVGAELLRLLVSERPSIGLRLLGWTRVLDAVLPELATQRGVPQNKVRGRDLWDHTNATVDAAARLAPGDVTLALAALLHDSGKPETRAEGRFLGHEEVGARIAEKVLRRLAIGGAQSERVVRLVRWHMFGYDEKWRDAAVRRFLAKVGPDLLDDLLRLREADNMGSGRPREATGVDELRARARAELDRQVPLSLADLAVDGRDLIDEVGLTPGPIVGALLARLLDSVISEPSRNVRDRLLADARHWAREPGIASRARRGADGDDDASERPDASGGDVTGGSVR